MAKKSMVQRELRRIKTVRKYAAKRADLKAKLRNPDLDPEERSRLQIQLRHPSPQTAVPTRLAQVGSQYFDPFTGLPMLWSPTQQKLYSVGKDRLDDGGDPTFDISVPAVVVLDVSGHTQAKSTGPAVTRSRR